ncbi:MAG: S-layer homology domain-containing protein [Tissierellaceae bacterium]
MKSIWKRLLILALIFSIILPIGALEAYASSGLTAYIDEIYGNEVIIKGRTLPKTAVTVKLQRLEDNNIRYTDETKSDEDGEFEFAINISSGEYKAIVSAIGLAVETRCNVNDLDSGTVTVRVEGKDATLLEEYRVKADVGYTTYYMAVTNALKDNNVPYTEKDGLIDGIGPKNEGAGLEGWQWMVNGGGGQTLPSDFVNENDDIVLVVGDLWNPTITQLKLSTKSGNLIDRNSVEIIKDNEFTVKFEQFDIDIFGDINKKPISNQTIRFGSERKQTDKNGEVVFVASREGRYTISSEPTKNKEGNPLIRPVPIDVLVREEGSEDPNIDPSIPIEKNSITLSVDTKTIGGGYYINNKEMELSPRDTAYDVLERAIGKSNLKTTGSSSSLYVASMRLNGKWIGEFDHGSGSGWMYNVNGKYPNISAGAYRLKAGDDVNWRYTTDLGEDLGHYIGDTPPVNEEEKIAPNIDKMENEQLKGLAKDILNKKMKDDEIKKEAEKIIGKIIRDVNLDKMKISEIKGVIKDLNIMSDVLVRKVKDVSYIEKILIDIIENMGKSKDRLSWEDSIKVQEELLSTIQDALEKKSEIRITKESIREEDIKDLDSIDKFNHNIIEAVEKSALSNGRKLEPTLIFNIDKKIDKITISKTILEKIIRSNLRYLNLNFNSGAIKIAIDQLSAEKDMIIIMRNMTSYTEIDITPRRSFPIPLTIELPYEQDGAKSTVIREDSNKKRTNIGGIYDKTNKKMIFTTNENSKYYITNGSVSFRDLQNYKWAEDSINQMSIKGIVKGKAEGIFAPQDNITRAEFATLLVKAVKAIEKDNDSKFRDVKSDDWYADYVKIASKSNLMSGKGKDIFDPNGNITREELAQAISNVLKSSGYGSNGRDYLKEFKDNDRIAEWAREGFNLAVQFEIINGTDNRLNPSDNATRAETIVMLNRLYKLIIY